MRFANPCSTGAEIPCALDTRTPKYSIFARTLGSARDFSSRNTDALVHTGLLSGATFHLESIVRIEEDGDRTFIDQLHGHHSLKNSGRDCDAQLAKRLAEFLVERFG